MKNALIIPAETTLADYRVDGIVIKVKVLAVRRAYGREEVLIQPALGNGQKWVQKAKIIENK